jgi:hypothetical protein
MLCWHQELVDAYNSSYLGGCNREDHYLRPVWTNSSRDPHLQNNQNKIDWKLNPSIRVPALKV